MIRYLDRNDVLIAGTAALGEAPAVADYGLLESALARPSATVFGLDAYLDVLSKAAALLHSLARNPALVDDNERTAWSATWTFLTINGVELAAEYDVDAAECLSSISLLEWRLRSRPSQRRTQHCQPRCGSCILSNGRSWNTTRPCVRASNATAQSRDDRPGLAPGRTGFSETATECD